MLDLSGLSGGAYCHITAYCFTFGINPLLFSSEIFNQTSVIYDAMEGENDEKSAKRSMFIKLYVVCFPSLLIGSGFGGFGITSMALADLDADEQYELYYTFSWGSGLHRSQVGYFDPIREQVTIFVDFSIKAQDLVGTIAFDGEKEEYSIIPKTN